MKLSIALLSIVLLSACSPSNEVRESDSEELKSNLKICGDKELLLNIISDDRITYREYTIVRECADKVLKEKFKNDVRDIANDL